VARPSPTLLRIISIDYLAQNFFVMIFAGWAIYFIDAMFEGEASRLLLVLAVIFTPLGLAAFYWRYNLITSTCRDGIEIPGRIIQIHTISTGKKRRDYVIDYEYQLDGQEFQYRNRVKKNNLVSTLKEGQSVTLLADEKKSKAAFIKELYIEVM
jgi:hypothetical protein